MITAATSYYEKHSDMLPKGEVSKVELNVTTLAKEGYMKKGEYHETM